MPSAVRLKINIMHVNIYALQCEAEATGDHPVHLGTIEPRMDLVQDFDMIELDHGSPHIQAWKRPPKFPSCARLSLTPVVLESAAWA
jgi:hypothetical protein